jgi:integrase
MGPVRYRDAGGRSQRLTIGAYPTVGLADARARAAEVRRAAVSGANPAAEKRDARENAEARTVDHLAARYLREHAARFKRPRPVAEDERNLRLHVLPKWGRRAFADIKRRDVVELIEGLVAADKPALAIGVKALISKMFNFAISRGLLEANPVAGIGCVAELQPRERVLSDDEIRLAWEAFGMPPFSRPVGLALRLALLTGARAGEVAGLTIGELEALDDPEEALWRLPGARAKNHREHVLPLSPLAAATVREAVGLRGDKKGSKMAVFASARADGVVAEVHAEPGGAAPDAHVLAVAMRRLSQALNPKATKAHLLRDHPGAASWFADPPSPHDLRRTAATRLAALGTPSDLVSAILNHAPAGVTARVYNHHDDVAGKRKALTAWAREIERLASGASSGTVVTLRARRVGKRAA